MFQVAAHPSAFALHSHGQYSANSQHNPSQSSPVQLPRTLQRPKFTDVSRDAIHAASPELAGVPSEYIRRGIRAKSHPMLAGLNAISASHMPSSLTRSQLPHKMTVPLRASSGEVSYPTHVLAISSSKSSSSDSLSIFPIHALTLAANCALLPCLPVSTASPTPNGTISLPVLPLSLPSPAAFSIIHSYLYTQRLDSVMKALFPVPAGFLQTLSHHTVKSALESTETPHQLSVFLFASASGNLRTLTNYAAHVKELWQDLVCLGLYEPELWDTLDLAWEIVLGALALAVTANQ